MSIAKTYGKTAANTVKIDVRTIVGIVKKCAKNTDTIAKICAANVRICAKTYAINAAMCVRSAVAANNLVKKKAPPVCGAFCLRGNYVRLGSQSKGMCCYGLKRLSGLLC